MESIAFEIDRQKCFLHFLLAIVLWLEFFCFFLLLWNEITITSSPAELPERINNTHHMCCMASWRQGQSFVVWVMDKQLLCRHTILVLFIVRFIAAGLHLIKENLGEISFYYMCTCSFFFLSYRRVYYTPHIKGQRSENYQKLKLNDWKREIRTLPRWRRLVFRCADRRTH